MPCRGGRKETHALVRTALQSYAATLPGITKPFDLPYYDPTELTKKATIAEVRRWREAELTHGRVAMLAALGWIVGEQADSSRAFFNADGHIQGTALEQAVAAGPNTWAPILLLVAALEARRVGVAFAPAEKGSGKKFFLSWGSLGVRTELADEYSMGDAGFDPLGLYPTDPARQRSAKDKELNNGRLAMVAVAGFCLQELAEPGVKILDHRWN